jgi:Family of unknown function (DUF6220)
MRGTARTIYVGAAALLTVGLIVQVFLAGLGVFDSAARFATHRDFGYLLELFPFVMIVTAWLGRMGRRFIGLSALVFAQFFLQSILVVMRESAPAIAALHPVNGFAIVLVTIYLLREAWPLRGGAAASEEPPVAAPGTAR